MFAREAGDSQKQGADQISHSQRLSLAKDFVARLKGKLSKANDLLYPDRHRSSNEVESNILNEGELLLLQPVLKDGARLESVIISQIKNGSAVVSLTDYADNLRLAIDVDSDGNKASGWYIREDRPFSLDMAKREVVAPEGTFNVSDSVFSQEGDIYVPSQELALWLGVEIEVDIPYQQIKIISDELMPLQEEEERKNRKYTGYEVASPRLPLGGEDYTFVSVPVVDVTTRSTYRKQDNDAKGEKIHQANVRTVGDFAGGTLSTLSQIDNTNRLARARVTYEKDSVDGDLLGRLKAKHLEIGDIKTASIPIGGNSKQELGVRVTNTDPMRHFTRANTAISGNAIPGWDVELYRHSQFLGIIHVGDDGFYSFDDVTLFSDNNFRLVFYGPQGERHEETIYVPYDRMLLSHSDGVYDISVSFDGQSAYINDNLKSSNNDRGSINLTALFEKPLADGLSGSVGFHSETHNEHRNYIGSAGLSFAQREALINASVAVDDEGDGAAEFSVRRDFGNHEMNYTSKWRGENFDGDSSSSDIDIDSFRNSLSVNGPLFLPVSNVFSARYNTGFSHEYESSGDSVSSSVVGMNFGYKNMSFSSDLNYRTGNVLTDDQLNSNTYFSIKKGDNSLRLSGDYEIKPEAEFERYSASYSRDFTDDLKMDLNVSKNVDQSLTSYQARLDWQAGFVRISPSVNYNSNNDLFAGVNTRFGLMREPISGDIKMFDKQISSNAFVSALVYLDKNGDGEFNNDDELLPDVVVTAPQNGRRAITNEKGVALFERMTSLRLTDVFVDKESLPDPVWIPGFEGVSIMPREGYVAEVEFPIHMSGELDGVVLANVVSLPKDVPVEEKLGLVVAEIEPASGVAPQEGEEGVFDATVKEYTDRTYKKTAPDGVLAKSRPVPLRNIELQLFNDKGEVEQSVITDIDGFYYFTNIPPGRYYLMISEKSAKRKDVIRPKPEPIEITYEGTVIYDHKIFVDTGAQDVPSDFIADLEDYKERHPHISFDGGDNEFVLNFGEYNSRLLMSLVWYKLRSRYGAMFGENTEPMVPPAESFANVKTGKHVLRVGLEGKTIDEAYSTCRSFMARDQYCKVEITPSYMNNERIRLAKATTTATDAVIMDGYKDEPLSVDVKLPEAEVLMVADEEPDTLNPFMKAVGVLRDGPKRLGRGVVAAISNTPEVVVETAEEKAERIRLEEEEVIKAMALDEELVRQIRARISATASAAATGRPISISAPSKVLIP